MTGYIWLMNGGGLLFYLGIGTLLFVIPHWIPQHVGIVTTVTLIMLYLIQPVGAIMSLLPSLRQADIALRKIEQLDNALVEAKHSQSTVDPFFRNGPLLLELQGVRHNYAGSEADGFMLGPLDLTVGQGEILFIIGGNGSGKTTLAMLLLGLYAPEGGVIRLNGESVTTENTDSYLRYFSAVFADFHLFEHLHGLDADGLNARALHYVKALDMAHKVNVVDGKFSTINLSTGQRKRLALVYAYLEDRPIYLFDEWAADQDPVFKRIFYAELLPELKLRGKTVIIITHDDAYFHYADRIVKLENGRLTTVSFESKKSDYDEALTVLQ